MKRTIVCVLGAVAVLAIFFTGLVRIHVADSEKVKAKYAACSTISDPTVRRDCVNGPTYKEEYIYPQG